MFFFYLCIDISVCSIHNLFTYVCPPLVNMCSLNKMVVEANLVIFLISAFPSCTPARPSPHSINNIIISDIAQNFDFRTYKSFHFISHPGIWYLQTLETRSAQNSHKVPEPAEERHCLKGLPAHVRRINIGTRGNL